MAIVASFSCRYNSALQFRGTHAGLCPTSEPQMIPPSYWEQFKITCRLLCFPSLCDWYRKLGLPSQTIRCKIKAKNGEVIGGLEMKEEIQGIWKLMDHFGSTTAGCHIKASSIYAYLSSWSTSTPHPILLYFFEFELHITIVSLNFSLSPSKSRSKRF